MKRLFVDTNIFIRYFVQDNPEQLDKVNRLLEKAKTKDVILIVLPEVLFEIEFVLRSFYKIEKNKRIDHLASIVESSYIEVPSRQIVINTLSLYKKHAVSIIDCWVYATAYHENGDIASFDTDFKKLKIAS